MAANDGYPYDLVPAQEIYHRVSRLLRIGRRAFWLTLVRDWKD